MYRLHDLKAEVGAVILTAVVERGTYRTICNNYGIIEHNLHSVTNTDKCIKFQRRIQT